MANDGLKKEFIDYLRDINLPENFIAIVEKIYFFYNEVCPEEIQDIFISEYMAEDLREYENLWLFSENYLMEAKRFIKEDTFDMTPFKTVEYWRITKIDYDFQNAINESRIHATIELNGGNTGEFKASKENCDQFKEIFLKYIVPKTSEY
jgi:hypothetical protein